MRTRLRLAIVVLAFLSAGLPAAAEDAKAAAALSAARQALGADKLETIKSLSAKGTHRRTLGQMQLSGDLQIDVTLPDRYLRSETNQMFGNSVTVEIGFDGDEPVQRSNSVGGGPNVVFRAGGPGGPGAPQDPAVLKANQLRAQRAEFTRLMLGWFATAPAFIEPTYTYSGIAESPDGRAEVVEVKGKSGFDAKLFLDEQTHRPLMLTYMGPKPVVRVMRSGTAPAGAQHGEPQDPARRGEQAVRDAAPQEAPQIVEMQVFFDDYRKVNGMWLPHRISRSVNGEPSEEIELQKIEIK